MYAKLYRATWGSGKANDPQRTRKTQITALGGRLSGFATLYPSSCWLGFVLAFALFALLASFADPCFFHTRRRALMGG